MAARLSTLAEVETAVWRELAACAKDKSHAWRTPVLATVDGDRADARTVVLREVEGRQLLIYTDERAGKVHQLLRHPHGTLVMWSPSLGWQLRCRVRLTIEMSGLAASSRWARIRLSPAAQDYLSPLAPGSPVASRGAGARTGHARLLRGHRRRRRVARLARVAPGRAPPRHLRRSGTALGAAVSSRPAPGRSQAAG